MTVRGLFQLFLENLDWLGDCQCILGDEAIIQGSARILRFMYYTLYHSLLFYFLFYALVVMQASNPTMHNEARAIKMSYLACCMREMGKSHVEKNDNGTAFLKFLLKARDSDMFPIGQVRERM